MQEADIAAAPLTITNDRDAIMDFTVPFQTTGLVVLTWKSPPKVATASSQLFRLLTSMHAGVWMLILTAYVIVSLALWVIMSYSPGENLRINRNTHMQYTATNSLWFGFSTLLGQGKYILQPFSLVLPTF